VLIDGTERGVTPMAAPIELPAGRHTLTIQNDFFADHEQVIEVPAGAVDDALEIKVDLEKSGRRLDGELRMEPDHLDERPPGEEP
jgi:hypothetical protein